MSTVLTVAALVINGHADFKPKSLSLFGRCKTMREVQQIHANMITTGVFRNIYAASQILALAADFGYLDYARLIFDRFEEPNSFFWFAMIRGYSKSQKDADEAIVLFCRMLGFACLRFHFVIPFVLKACLKIPGTDVGRQVHAHVIKGGYLEDRFVVNALIQMYTSCGDLLAAKRIFDRMVNRDVVSWTLVVEGFAKSGKMEAAHRLFEEMPHRDLIAWNVMIDGYTKSGRMEDARALFYQIPQTGIVSWNSMISGYTRRGEIKLAQELFDQMPEKDITSWNAMIDGYVKCDQVAKAQNLFDLMPSKDEVSWTTLIVGYARENLHKKAVALFRKMLAEGINPDSATLVVILCAIACLGFADEGKWVHAYIQKNGFDINDTLGCALIDMYSKCGLIGTAYEIFKGIRDRGIGHWNAMISGFGMHGLAEDALRVFNDMLESGMYPNEISFIGILNACSHSGLLSEGELYFNLMQNKYHFVPTIQHYGCMVDLLSRAGRIEEARKFIDEMPIQPDPTLLKSLLSGCLKHGNVEVGQWIGSQLITLTPNDSGCYILLSNIYAKAKMWGHAAKIRKMLKEKAVPKVPGCSLIMINGTICELFAGQNFGIHENMMLMLSNIVDRLKDEGYVPDLRQVYLDLDESNKEAALISHSEKLALAYGLLNVEQGMQIQIVKNLRVCGDCHTFMQIASRVYNHEIILRDQNRFHHFKEGVCSCKNYW